jgi:hypothetical protein
VQDKYLEDGIVEYKLHTGGDATHNGYTDAYTKLFNDLKNNSINFLEIGVFQGRSLAMWSDYFVNGTIYGIDISTKEFELMKPELEKMGAFSNNNLGFIRELNSMEERPNNLNSCFSIIIDDGDHNPTAQWETFKNYWPILCSGGIYVIEDIHENWSEKIKNEMIKFKTNDIDNVSIFSTIDESYLNVVECKNNSRLLVIKKI